MGTEIYMKWEGASEEEAQIVRTGAGLWMKKQNWLLRKMFGDAWYEEDFAEFDFLSNRTNCELLLMDYEEGLIEGVYSEQDRRVELDMRIMEEAVQKLLEKFPEVQTEQTITKEQEAKFLLSVTSFYALGLALQQEKKKPEILISW